MIAKDGIREQNVGLIGPAAAFPQAGPHLGWGPFVETVQMGTSIRTVVRIVLRSRREQPSLPNARNEGSAFTSWRHQLYS